MKIKTFRGKTKILSGPTWGPEKGGKFLEMKLEIGEIRWGARLFLIFRLLFHQIKN